MFFSQWMSEIKPLMYLAMEIDFDPLEDIFSDNTVKNARPVGKYQPKGKAKHRPTKRDVAAPSVSSSKPAQTNETTATELNKPVKDAKLSAPSVSSSEPAQTIVTAATDINKPIKDAKLSAPSVSSSEHAQTIETAATDINKPVKDAKLSENCLEVVFNGNEHGRASTENPVVETGDVLIGLETLGDILPNNITDMGIAPLSEVSSPKNAKSHVLPVPAFPDDIIPSSDGGDVLTCPELPAGLDPLTAGETFVSSGECEEVHDDELNREEMDIMDSIILSELTTDSGQRRGQFLPTQKVSTNELISCSLASQSDQPESNYAEKDSVSTFQQDDMLDLSYLGLNHTLPAEVTLEIPLDNDSVDHIEGTQTDSGIHVDVEPEIPVKLASRRANKSSKTPTASAPSSQRYQASTSGEDNEICRSLRPRKNKPNLCALDEVEEEAAAGEDNSDEIPISSAVEAENVTGESQVENETPKKVTRKRKPKKPDDGKEKPARKRKKAEEAQDKNETTKPKKFSHSTRRRRVDRALLETPEEQLDYQKLTFRDLILLAEHKEQETKKEAAAGAGATTTNQSNGNTSSHHKEDETFNKRQHKEYNDGEGNPEMEDTTVYFNYHSHMDRTPVARWYKQETELFYEAVRQFGTDLSMIQQLFPDRTRRQLKLKYKKEERQHPLRLREALTHRSTDHSYFQKVIEQLQIVASKENQNSDNVDPGDVTGNDADEGASNVGKEESKEEQIEEEQKEDTAAANDFDVESTPNFDDFEDESLLSQYK